MTVSGWGYLFAAYAILWMELINNLFMKKFLLPFMLLSIIIATPILTHAQSPDWETSQDGMFEVFEYNRDTDTYYTHTKPRVGHLYLIDQENNGNPEYNTGFKVGSKIYGYIYNPYRHRPEQLSVQFEYKVPKGVCMKADGLPALLDDLVLDSQDPYNKPKLITPEYIQAQYNNTMNIIESKPINLKDASVSFNSNIP